MGLWHLVAQLAVNGHQHGLDTMLGSEIQQQQMLESQSQSQPKWAGELMIALLQFPMALQRCGIGSSTQRMFLNAIHSLKDVHVRAVFPEDRIQAMKATDRMARAVKAWTNWDFKNFGKQVGMLLRELVMLAFPQKYSLSHAGSLRHELLGYSAQTPSIFAGRQNRHIFTAIVAGCAISVFVAFAAVRSIWSANRELGSDFPFIDVEGELTSQRRQMRSCGTDRPKYSSRQY